MGAINWFWIWVVLAAVLCVGEMLSLSFFMLPFAVGALFAAIANAFKADLIIQWVVFIVVSVIALIALRPVARRITRRSANVKSGAERLVDSVGEVIEGRAPDGLVRVRVERDEWNASVEGGGHLAVGTRIQVIGIDGTRLIIIPYEDPANSKDPADPADPAKETCTCADKDEGSTDA